MEDFRKGQCRAKDVNSPRSIEAMLRLGIKKGDLESKTREQVTNEENLTLMHMKTREEKQFYIQTKLTLLEQQRLQLLEKLSLERSKVTEEEEAMQKAFEEN